MDERTNRLINEYGDLENCRRSTKNLVVVRVREIKKQHEKKEVIEK